MKNNRFIKIVSMFIIVISILILQGCRTSIDRPQINFRARTINNIFVNQNGTKFFYFTIRFELTRNLRLQANKIITANVPQPPEIEGGYINFNLTSQEQMPNQLLLLNMSNEFYVKLNSARTNHNTYFFQIPKYAIERLLEGNNSSIIGFFGNEENNINFAFSNNLTRDLKRLTEIE